MPIIRTYGDVGVFGMGAHQAGLALGRADRLAQQREIDARFVENRLAAREQQALAKTQGDYALALQRQAGAPRGAAESSRAETLLNDLARDRADAREQAALQALEEQKLADQQRGLLSALDDSYANREKDFTYHYAKDQILKGEKLPSRIQAALGIETPSEVEARARRKAEEGQIDDFKPQSQTERVIRRTLAQGRGADIAAMLDDRQDAGFGQVGDLTTDALAARTQLEGFALATNDKAALMDIREDLEEAGVSSEARKILDDRIAELEEEDAQIKAPAAFEQAVKSFQSRLDAIQTKEERSLNISEKRALLGSTLKQTADSYGITIQQLGDFIRANDENRRMAEQLVSQAQEAIRKLTPPAEAPTGTEQQFGPDDPKRPEQSPRRGDFGMRGSPADQ